jgi:nicotinamide mononucleotide transporter
MTDPIILVGTETSLLELFAVFCGLASVWSMKKESILAYPFGIVNVLIYVYICFNAKLYAYAGINVFYAVMSVYGWINWARKGGDQEKLKISSLRSKEWMIYIALVALFFFILRAVLIRFTNSEVPTWDAITTAVYIIGMWLLARKKIENWYFWIVGDSISIFLFLYLGLLFSSLQFLVFTIIAILGFIEWRKKLKSAV